jgi:hypothetical protein
VLFAQLVTTSPHQLCSEAKHKILLFMEDFLDSADYTQVREEEVNNGYKWSTLVPFMKLAYHPPHRGQGDEEDGDCHPPPMGQDSEGDGESNSSKWSNCCDCGESDEAMEDEPGETVESRLAR